MLPPKEFLETLSEQATRLFSQQSPIAPAELEKQLKALLQSAFSKLDLVSREEFEGQMLVLARTRKRLEELEKHVQALEQKLEQNPTQ